MSRRTRSNAVGMFMKTAFVLMLLGTVMVILAVGPAAAATVGSDGLVTVRLSEVVRSVFYAPQYVAINLGFFEDEGLQIELSTAWGAHAGMAALISNSVDIGFFGPEATVYVYEQGAPDYPLGFAQLTQRDGSFLMARGIVDPAEFDWTDLRGKVVVGGRKGGVPEMMLEWILTQYGITPYQDVGLVTHLAFDAAAGAFQGGLGDYVAQFDPTLTHLERAGVGTIVASLGAEGGSITYTVYHARQSYMESHPEIIEAFTRAIYRGQRWVAEHSTREIAEVVASFFPGMDLDIIETALNRYREIDAWSPDPLISPEGFANLQKVMMNAGELNREVPFDALMTNRFAESVVRSYSGE